MIYKYYINNAILKDTNYSNTIQFPYNPIFI